MTASDNETAPATEPEPPVPAPTPVGNRWTYLSRNTLVVTVIGALVGAVVTGLATGWAEELFADAPPPSCPGADCDGRNPESEGCGEDGSTFKPRVDNPVALQIRYSPRCRAVWGKIEAGEPGDKVAVTVVGGATREAEITYDNDQFTRMAVVEPHAFKVKVCATPTHRDNRQGSWEPYCVRASEATHWR